MTETTDPEKAGDYRRAAALVAHHHANNQEGAIAVVHEAAEVGRPLELLGAVLGLYGYLLPELRTPVAISWLMESVLDLAGMEHA